MKFQINDLLWNVAASIKVRTNLDLVQVETDDLTLDYPFIFHAIFNLKKLWPYAGYAGPGYGIRCFLVVRV